MERRDSTMTGSHRSRIVEVVVVDFVEGALGRGDLNSDATVGRIGIIELLRVHGTVVVEIGVTGVVVVRSVAAVEIWGREEVLFEVVEVVVGIG